MEHQEVTFKVLLPNTYLSSRTPHAEVFKIFVLVQRQELRNYIRATSIYHQQSQVYISTTVFSELNPSPSKFQILYHCRFLDLVDVLSHQSESVFDDSNFVLAWFCEKLRFSMYTPWRHIGVVEESLHSFFTSALFCCGLIIMTNFKLEA
jgi:hypothetical protein